MKSVEINDHDLIRFAENASELSLDAHRSIMEKVAGDPELRKKVAQVRKDLYLVETQIPEYSISTEFHGDLKNLAELWLKSRFEKRLKMRKFLFGKEFLTFAAVMIGILLVALTVIYLRW